MTTAVRFEPNPQPDPELRRTLLDYFVENQTAAELADWLRDIGQDPLGTVQERRDRVRAGTKYLAMPTSEFPQQTRYYLDLFPVDHLSGITEALGLSDDGTKDALYRRILREVGYREGWLPRITRGAAPEKTDVGRFLAWYPVVKRGSYERDFYASIGDELAEVYGIESVHQQLAVAHGTTLKIDFHVGHPQREGIGIEVKMPNSNADIQRLLGQIDQYLHRYGSQLLLLLIPDFLEASALVFVRDQLALKGVTTIVKDGATTAT